MAAMFDLTKIPRVLLENECDVTPSNNDGKRPAKNNNPEVDQLFLTNGGNQGLENKSGRTTEDMAISNDYSSAQRVLESFEVIEQDEITSQTYVIKKPKSKIDFFRSRLVKLNLDKDKGKKCTGEPYEELREIHSDLEHRFMTAQFEKNLEIKRLNDLNTKLRNQVETLTDKSLTKDSRVEELSKMVEYLSDTLSKEEETHLKSRRQVEDMDNQILELQVQLDKSSLIGGTFWDEIEDVMSCVICTEKLRDPVTLHCAHTFCTECLDNWRVNGKNDCPTCRAKITGEVKVYVLKQLLEKWSQNFLKITNIS